MATDVNFIGGGLDAVDSGGTDVYEFAPYFAPIPGAIVAPSVAPVLQFQSTLVQGAVDFGRDVSTFPDLDGAVKESDDKRLLGEALLRRFTTPRGKLSFHEDYGTDLRQYLNEAVTDDVLSQIKHDCELEVLQDERFDSAEVSVLYNASTRGLFIQVEVTTADGPFEFTLSIDQLTAVLLTAEEA